LRAGVLALFLLALPALPVREARAQMYKCVDARGVTAYSDKPCPDGRGREVDIQGQPPISGKVTPYREDIKAAEREFQRRQAKQERERLAETRARESQQRQCAAKRSELQRASSVRRPADADAHDARIARLQAEVVKLCR
jgi:sRNA-binding protein